MSVDQNNGKLEHPVEGNVEEYEHLLDDYSHLYPQPKVKF